MAMSKVISSVNRGSIDSVTWQDFATARCSYWI